VAVNADRRGVHSLLSLVLITGSFRSLAFHGPRGPPPAFSCPFEVAADRSARPFATGRQLVGASSTPNPRTNDCSAHGPDVASSS